MYCGKCGKEVENGIKFCPHCGKELEKASTQQEREFSGNSYGRLPKILLQIQEHSKLITCILWFILAMAFLVTMFSTYTQNMGAFEWVNVFYKILGVVICIVIPAGVVIDCVKTILNFKEGRMNKENVFAGGLSMCIAAIALKIGSWIFDDWTIKSDFSLVMFRVFRTYKNLVSWAFIIGAVIIGLSVFMSKKDNLKE